jgi:hypothetical protein
MKRGSIVAALATVGCATSPPAPHWTDGQWVPIAAVPAHSMEHDRRECIEQVVVSSQPNTLDERTVRRQSLHNSVARFNLMRICMRDRGWRLEPDPEISVRR